MGFPTGLNKKRTDSIAAEMKLVDHVPLGHATNIDCYFRECGRRGANGETCTGDDALDENTAANHTWHISSHSRGCNEADCEVRNGLNQNGGPWNNLIPYGSNTETSTEQREGVTGR